eukprot:3056360-Prymnesium_polylepis.1
MHNEHAELEAASTAACPVFQPGFDAAGELTEEEEVEASADEQLDALWRRLKADEVTDPHASWPQLREIKREVESCDYEALLKHDADWRCSSKSCLGEAPGKLLCAVGVVAKAEIEWCPGTAQLQWTGMLGGRTTGLGLVRLSSACVPPGTAGMRRA